MQAIIAILSNIFEKQMHLVSFELIPRWRIGTRNSPIFLTAFAENVSQMLLNNVGRNVKAHCVLIANVIILRTQWLFWENESLECNPIRYIIVLIAKVTPRPQLLYVSVYRLTYHHEMHQ